MCISRLVLLPVFFLMLPEDARSQPSSFLSGTAPTSSVVKPQTQGGTLQPSAALSPTSQSVPGLPTMGPTLVTPMAPENKTTDLFTGEGRVVR